LIHREGCLRGAGEGVERRKDAFGGSIFMEAGPDLGTSFGEKETDVFNEAAVYNLLKYLIAEKSGGLFRHLCLRHVSANF
jgi:hypothetical protein